MIGLIVCSLLAVPVVYFAVTYILHLMSLKNYPGGLFPLPIIGNMHQVGKTPHETFTEWSKTYGDVYSVSFGMKRIVFINAYEPAIEALSAKSASFAGRDQQQYLANLLSLGCKDIVFGDYGKRWKFLRKIGHMALLQHGDREAMSDHLQRESDELKKRLVQLNGAPTSPREQFGVSVMNVINILAYGERFEIDDEDYKTVMKIAWGVFMGLKNGDPITFLPWLRFFPSKTVTIVNEAVALRRSFLRRKIHQHESTFDPNNLCDLTDNLLDLMYKKDELQKHEIKEMDYDDIEIMLSDILLAGFETTLTTLEWAMLYLIHWPQYQQEIYQEMLKQLGPDLKPTLDDRSVLHLLEATIQETLRLSTVSPSGVPHKTTENTSVAGIPVPTDTTVIFNLWQIHHDERYWEKPNEFNPHRWLDEEGKYTPHKHREFLVFSAGKRSCFGEQVARSQLFSCLSMLLWEFEILPNPDEPFPSLDCQCGIVLFPLAHTVIFKRRNCHSS